MAASALIAAGAVAISTASSSAASVRAHPAANVVTPHTTAPTSGCSSTPPATGEHCLPIAATVTGTSDNSGGRCTAIVVLQVQLNPNVIS
jgi:hypothetical protein